MFPSTIAPKWPILVSQCGMDHQKPTILLIFGTLSLGGCGGHPMTPKLNLKNEGQMSRPNEYTDNFKSNLTCIFFSLRAKLKNTFCLRTLCMTTIRGCFLICKKKKTFLTRASHLNSSKEGTLMKRELHLQLQKHPLICILHVEHR